MSQLLRQRMAGGLKCQKTLDSTVRPGEVTFGVEDTPSAKEAWLLKVTGVSEQVRAQRQGKGLRWIWAFPGERAWMLSGFGEDR